MCVDIHVYVYMYVCVYRVNPAAGLIACDAALRPAMDYVFGASFVCQVILYIYYICICLYVFIYIWV